MIMNPTEFSEALFQYADENNQKLVLIKGGMYPVFELDGVEYTAERIFCRFGATVHCTMTHPEADGTENIPENRKMLYRLVNGPYILLLVLFIFMAVTRQSVVWAGLVALMIFPYLLWVFRIFPRGR